MRPYARATHCAHNPTGEHNGTGQQVLLAGYRAMTTYLATLRVNDRSALLADTRQTLDGILDAIDSGFLETVKKKEGRSKK